MYKTEWDQFRFSVYLHAVRIFQGYSVHFPAFSLSYNVAANSRKDRGIKLFDLSVGLKVILRNCKRPQPQLFTNNLK